MKVMKALPDAGPVVHVIQHSTQIRAVLALKKKKTPFFTCLNKKKHHCRFRPDERE